MISAAVLEPALVPDHAGLVPGRSPRMPRNRSRTVVGDVLVRSRRGPSRAAGRRGPSRSRAPCTRRGGRPSCRAEVPVAPARVRVEVDRRSAGTSSPARLEACRPPTGPGAVLGDRRRTRDTVSATVTGSGPVPRVRPRPASAAPAGPGPGASLRSSCPCEHGRPRLPAARLRTLEGRLKRRPSPRPQAAYKVPGPGCAAWTPPRRRTSLPSRANLPNRGAGAVRSADAVQGARPGRGRTGRTVRSPLGGPKQRRCWPT